MLSFLAARFLSLFPHPSHAQVVEELCHNSIDAGASHIRVTIHGESLTVTVADDGAGVAESDFPLLAMHHHTSKLQNARDLEEGLLYLGFRGEALASLAEVSVLEIVSKPRNSFRAMQKIVRAGHVAHMGACVRLLRFADIIHQAAA